MAHYFALFILSWISFPIRSSMAFLLPSNAGSLSYAKANLPSKKTSSTTQHYFKSPLVQEALDQCILDRNVDPDQMIDLLENLSNEHDLRPNQSYDCQRDLQGSFEFVFSSSIAEIPLIGKRLFRGYYLPMREIIHFDFTNLTMGMEVKLLPLPNFPTFTLQGHDLQWHPNEAQLTYQFDGKDNTSVWNILYADGNMLVAKCSVHLGLVVLRRIPPLELQALNEERGHTTTATTDN